MVSIYVEGNDRTGQFKDWEIFDRHNTLTLRLHFHSGKSYAWPLDICKVVPSRVVKGGLCTERGSSAFSNIEEATIYGEKYAVVRYADSQKAVVMNAAGMEFVADRRSRTERYSSTSFPWRWAG